MALARSLSDLSGDASFLMLGAGLDNVCAVIEELGLRGRAVYLPTSLTPGQALSLISLHRSSSAPIPSRGQRLHATMAYCRPVKALIALGSLSRARVIVSDVLGLTHLVRPSE